MDEKQGQVKPRRNHSKKERRRHQFSKTRMASIGKRAREARKVLGYSQPEAAIELKTSVNTISRIENGKTLIPIEYLVYLMEKGITSDYILSGKPPLLAKESKTHTLEKVYRDPLERIVDILVQHLNRGNFFSIQERELIRKSAAILGKELPVFSPEDRRKVFFQGITQLRIEQKRLREAKQIDKNYILHFLLPPRR